nr:hypothetical protein CFP56_70562 [Quercus suber]
MDGAFGPSWEGCSWSCPSHARLGSLTVLCVSSASRSMGSEGLCRGTVRCSGQGFGLISLKIEGLAHIGRSKTMLLPSQEIRSIYLALDYRCPQGQVLRDYELGCHDQAVPEDDLR